MEDTLKRLLAAETRASEIADQAGHAAEALLQSTLQDVRQQEGAFNDRLPELRSAYLDKADQRAAQSIKELEKRHADRITHLRARAESFEEEALDAAFSYLLGNGR